MKISQVLENALVLIRDEKNWTRGVHARDKGGDPCSPSDIRACSFCSVGAVMCITGEFSPEYFEAIKSLEYTVKYEVPVEDSCFYLSAYNDAHTHDKVMQVWRKTIHRERSHGR